MHPAGIVALILGFLVVGVSYIALLVAAFQESILWGVLCFFFPIIAGLVFTILHWDDVKGIFFLALGGIAVIIVGSIISHVTA